MWIVSLLPSSLIHLFTLLGFVLVIAGFVFGFVPFIKKYILPIQVVGIIIFTFGIFLEGMLVVYTDYKLKKAELEVRLAKAEAKANEVNTIIVTKVLEKKQVIKQKGDEVIKYIDREIKVYDDTCKIPQQVILAHDAAAQNKTVDEILTNNSILNTQDHNKAASGVRLPKK